MNGSTYSLNPDRCIVCHGTKLNPKLKLATPYLDQSEQYTIQQCDNCHHAIAIGRCDFDYLSSIYSESFFASDQQSMDSPHSAININSNLRAQHLAKQYTGQLLDIGAGNGAFLKAARHHGFDAEGVEFSAVAAEKARHAGFGIFEGDFSAVDFLGRTYNVITMWDVLASLHDPVAVLTKCNGLLEKHGVLVITLPMIDSTIAKVMKERWPLMIPPVNLNFFTKQSVHFLAEQTGFDVHSVHAQGKNVSLKFVAIKAVRGFRLNSLEPVVSKLIPNWNIPLNTADIATVILEKKPG